MAQPSDGPDNEALIPLILAEQEAREESTLLYQVSKAINQAVSLMEILQATKQLFAAPIDVGIFIWEHYERTNASYVETIISTDVNLPPGIRMPRTQVLEMTTLGSGEVVVVNDAYSADYADLAIAGSARQFGLQGIAGTNLMLNQRVLGFLAIASYVKHEFTERETRLMAAVADLTAAALERFRLRDENETARRYAEIVASINRALLQAADEEAILAAVVHYAERQGAQGALLNYYKYELPQSLAQNLVMPSIAVWRQGEFRTFDQSWELLKPPHPLNRAMIMMNLDEPTTIKYIEDMTTHERFPEAERQDWAVTHQTRGIASLPLYSGGRFFGVLDLLWFEPHTFSDEECFIYSQLLQTLPSVVASRRAYLVEAEARQERELLFAASEAINEANTYAEVVRGVEKLDLSKGDVHLTLVKYLNSGRDKYYEVVAATDRLFKVQGVRREKDALPTAGDNYHAETFLIENVETDLTLDETDRAWLRKFGIRSVAGYPLRFGERVLGALSLVDKEPHRFSSQDRRLFETLGRLVVAAVERIRLQEETALARQRAETLAYLNGRLLQATDETSILKALVPYVERQGADAMMIHYFDPIDPLDVANMQQAEVWRKKEVPADAVPPLERAAHPVELVIQHLVVNQPEAIQYTTDVTADPRIAAADRVDWAATRDTRGWVALPLYSAGRALGLLNILWFEAHSLSDEEFHIYSQLLQTLPSVVASRRAYLLELEARQERELLFEASAAINEANTYKEVVQGVKKLNLSEGDVSLILYRHTDFGRDGYYEIVAATNSLIRARDTRIPRSSLAALEKLQPTATYVIEDVEADSKVDNANLSYLRSVGIRSIIGYPMRFGERLLGTLSIVDIQVRQYSQQQRRLFETLGRLVVAAVERIRLQEETTLARQHAETLAYLNGKLLQATDEKSILKALAPYVEQQGADAMMLYYFDPNDPLDVVNVQQAEVWRRDPILPYDLTMAPHAIEYALQHMIVEQPESIQYTSDVTADPRFSEADRQDWAAARYTRGWVALPLYSGGRALGLMDILWFAPHVLSAEEFHIYSQLLQTLPSVVGSRRAYLAEQEAREEQEALFSASKAINAAMTFDDIARAVASLKFASDDVHIAIFENYDFDKATSVTILGSAHNAFGSQGHALPLDPMFHRVRDLAMYEMVAMGIATEGVITSQTFKRYGIEAGLMANLTFDNRWIGRLGLMDATRRAYSAQEKRLAVGLAGLVAAAVERIRLQQETAAALDRAERLNAQIQKLAAVEERNRLARELHDSVSQALYGIGLGTQTALAMWERDSNIVKESLDYILTLSEAAMVEMRALIFELRPESLENEGLVTALSKQAASLQARHRLDVQMELCEEPNLSLEVKESLYRVVREALHNVVKHSGAAHIVLRMRCAEYRLHLEVVDDGVGFETDREFPGHLGMHSMRERMEQLGGRFTITSAPGKGTHLSIEIPVPKIEE